MKIVSNLINNPESSVPKASGTLAETKATYDFWDSPYIKPAQLRQGHINATLDRIKNHQVILAIQDTTELNYTTHKAVKGAGYLDSKYARGLKVHSTLAATTEGLPLGIIDQYVWAREPESLGKSARPSQKSTESKESQRWLDALKNTSAIIPDSQQVITIADREADFYDLFACAKREGADFLIRATQNRCLESSDNHLKEEMELVDPQASMTVELKRNPTRSSRQATLTIRYQTLTIQPPQNRAKQLKLTPLELQVILVKESATPASLEQYDIGIGCALSEFTATSLKHYPKKLDNQVKILTVFGEDRNINLQPDREAILKEFLMEYAAGKSLFAAVWQAQKRLEDFQNLPGATWLPMIFQSLTDVPPTWQLLQGKNERLSEISAKKFSADFSGLIPNSIAARRGIKTVFVALSVSSIAAFSVVVIREMGILEPFQLKVFDSLMRTRPAEPPDPRLLIIEVTPKDVSAQVRPPEEGKSKSLYWDLQDWHLKRE
jgi:hypothetical protein